MEDVSRFEVRGELCAVLRKPDGSTITTKKKNLVVNGGVDFIAAAMASPSSRPSILGYIGIGSGTVAVDAADTALGTELDRNAATYDHDIGTTSFTMTATFAAGEGTGNVTEAGIFNAATTGTMFNRIVFSAIPKEAGDALDLTFTITFTPA